jgi:hypothetical protein
VVIIYKKDFPLPEKMKQMNRIEYDDVSDLTEKLKKKVHR